MHWFSFKRLKHIKVQVVEYWEHCLINIEKEGKWKSNKFDKKKIDGFSWQDWGEDIGNLCSSVHYNIVEGEGGRVVKRCRRPLMNNLLLTELRLSWLLREGVTKNRIHSVSPPPSLNWPNEFIFFLMTFLKGMGSKLKSRPLWMKGNPPPPYLSSLPQSKGLS